MSSHLVIKSIPNGIKLQLDPSVEFETLLQETAEKFHQSAGFFKGGNLAVSFTGRPISEEEEKSLIKCMEDNGEFSVLYVIGPQKSPENDEDDEIIRSLNEKLSPQDTTGFGTVYQGSVYKGEHLQFPCGVVVMGDIEPGGLVRASGNVIVLGGLYGSVNLEVPDGKKPGFIYASEMSPERIKIGDFRYYSEKSKWSIRPKYQCKVAYLKGDKVVVEPVSNNVLKDMIKN